jgi:hypothetical protein
MMQTDFDVRQSVSHCQPIDRLTLAVMTLKSYVGNALNFGFGMIMPVIGSGM